MTHADVMKHSLAGTPGRECPSELIPVGSTVARHYYFCAACHRAVVLDDNGTLFVTYPLGPVSRVLTRLVARLDARFFDPKGRLW